MVTIENSCLVLVDVQGNLARSVVEKENLYQNLSILIRGLQLLQVPILRVEQTPEKLGPTIPEIAGLLDDTPAIRKSSFSCWGCDAFRKTLQDLDRPQVLVAGIEAHVCVYQTTLQLLENGYQVEVIADAVSSRTARNREIALTRLAQAGARLSSTEMVLFELMRNVNNPAFRDVIKLVK